MIGFDIDLRRVEICRIIKETITRLPLQFLQDLDHAGAADEIRQAALLLIDADEKEANEILVFLQTKNIDAIKVKEEAAGGGA